MVLISHGRRMIQDVPNLRHLRVFQLTMAERSVNRAAQEANLSQPAVTQAIAKLEEEFGCLLFERRSVGMFPTRCGELVGIRVDRALRLLAEAGRRLASAARHRNSRSPAAFERSVSVSQLRALIAVARSGSFVGAARLLGIAQPSVHRAASQLEALVGVTLFERVSQGMVLSRMGHMLARSANLMFHEIELARQDVATAKGVVIGRAVIGSLPLAQTHIVPQALHALSQRYPAASFAVVDGAYEHLLEALRNGEVDVLIGALRIMALGRDVEEQPLFEDSLSILARRGHPLHGQPDLTPALLSRFGWVASREGSPGRDAFNAMFDRAGVAPPEGVIETGSFAVLRGLLLGSDRLAMLSLRQGRYEIESGLLAPLPFALSGTARSIGLTLRTDFLPTELQAALINELRAAATA